MVTEKPLFHLESLPLSWTYLDSPVSEGTNGIERAAWGMASMVEDTLLGTLERPMGVAVPWGLSNAPGRGTISDEWTIVTGVRSMLHYQFHNGYRGPYALVYGAGWDEGEEKEFKRIPLERFEIREGGETVPDVKVDHVWKSLRLLGKRALLVQLSPEVVQLVVALEPMVVLWKPDTYKVLCIIVPRILRDFRGNTGIIDWHRN